MIDLKNMDLEELREFLSSMGQKPFRGKQIFSWISRGVEDFSEMTDLSVALREKLAAGACISSLNCLRTQISEEYGTRKYLFEIPGGSAVETVFMKYRYGNSVCISSQAGCAMGCKFCASGLLGLQRNLSAGEMYDQVLKVEKDTGERISHIVVMGTGEPLANYEELSRFLHMVHDPEGLNISMRNITVSTCGLIPQMAQFAGDFPQTTLAVSLHAPSDTIRSKLMPINKKYPMKELLQASRDYCTQTGRRITFEYALIRGVNDGIELADMLASRLRGILCHVNIIPLNQVDETGLQTSGRKHGEEFRSRLEVRGINATLRRELGSDISAACGQLRLQNKKR